MSVRIDSGLRAKPALRRLLGKAAIVAAVAVGLTAGCATNPATGRRQFSLIGEGQEVAIGKQADGDIQRSLGLYADASLQAYIQQLGSVIAAGSERPELPWTFRVVDDPVVNAFALPGGYIYLTRGILAHMGSEAELVSVIGHEIGHVTGRHGVNRMSKAQLATLGLGVGMIARPELAEQFGSLAQNGLGLLFLKYGRDDEREADDLGLRYMRRAAYDPRPMADMFTLLKRVGEASGGGRVPDWMSTHPNPDERRERVAAAIAAGGSIPANAKVVREAYLRRLDQIVFGADPREGYFEGSLFLHPQMQLKLRFPAGWKTNNQKDAVIAVSDNQDGMVRMRLSAQTTADSAADTFLRQEGVSGDGRRERINGATAVVCRFEAPSQNGRLLGNVAFIEHQDRVFEVLGVATEAAWDGHARVVGQTIDSFDEVRDRRVLDIQPARVELVELRDDMTVQRFHAKYPSSVPIETVALINHVQLDSRLDRGQLVKRIVGGPAYGR